MNQIHSTAIVHDSVIMGDNNFVGPYVVIGPNVKIGNHNMFVAHCSVGLPAEHRDYWDKYGEVEIGSDNIIREFTTINSSTKGRTMMGDRCIMLRNSHLSHDSILEDDVTLSCNVLVGGESYIMRGVNVGLGAIMHQRSIIGSYSMIGMGSVITKGSQITPGNIYVGTPARYLKMNKIGLERNKIDNDSFAKECERFSRIIQLRDKK